LSDEIKFDKLSVISTVLIIMIVVIIVTVIIIINTKVISFTKKVMSYWRARMLLHTENKLIETDDINIQSGMFQVDSLSPLVFCISLIPRAKQLNSLKTGYEEHTIKTKISHLIYGWFEVDR